MANSGCSCGSPALSTQSHGSQVKCWHFNKAFLKVMLFRPKEWYPGKAQRAGHCCCVWRAEFSGNSFLPVWRALEYKLTTTPINKGASVLGKGAFVGMGISRAVAKGAEATGGPILRIKYGGWQLKETFGSHHSMGMKNGSSGTRIQMCCFWNFCRFSFFVSFSLTLCYHSDHSKILQSQRAHKDVFRINE